MKMKIDNDRSLRISLETSSSDARLETKKNKKTHKCDEFFVVGWESGG